MRILFLHHSEALRRTRWYLTAAEQLHAEFGHHVVFVYSSRHRDVVSSAVPVIRFEDWVEKHRSLVEAQDVRDCEARFPRAHLWLCAVAERSFTDYSFLGRGHYCRRLPLADIETYLKAVVLFYETVTREHGVEIAVAHAPDNIHSTVLYELASDLGFHAIGFYRDVYWDPKNHYLLDDQYYRSDLLRHRYRQYLDRYDELVTPVQDECSAFVRQRVAKGPMESAPALLRRDRSWAILRNAALGFWRARSLFRPGPRGAVASVAERDFLDGALSALTRAANQVRTARLGERSLDQLGRFVFFPLHLQPEATMLVSAPCFNNQLAVVQAISAGLPAGYRLAVKDHPLISGRRPRSFYQAIMSLPNAHLLAPDVSGSQVVERCAAVVTVKGTVGLEALLRGKPVLALAPVWYEDVAGVTKVEDFGALPRILKSVLFARPSDSEMAYRHKALLAFVAAYRSIMMREPDYESDDPVTKGRGMARLIQRLLQTRTEALACAGTASLDQAEARGT
ncbi:MAG: hypothetical protein HY744_28330 [Deltaproteobacteria bacterium]|nr:hypothetical protein [Deltaproteobacteria bacterium]